MNTSQIYSQDLGALEALSPNEQHELACRYARDRDPRDAQRLVLANLRLVVSVARRLGGRRTDFMDLVQEGNAGLLTAIERFDPARGTRLSTYAVIWIRAYILRHLMESSSLVRTTTTRHGRARFFARTLPLDVSLDAPLRTIDGESGATALDRLPSGDELRPDTLAETHEELVRLREIVARFRATLDARERAIFEGRVLDEPPRPLRKLGATLDLSGERVRQLEHDMLVRLRELVNGPPLAS
jgi:RNA polymerase sigma factor (sigma-70 family)